MTDPKPLSRYWLLLGVAALAIAGLFSLVLVVARTPALASLPMFGGLFHKALVVHVDLSVLVWFLAIACMLWSLLIAGTRQAFPYLEEAALICFVIGTLALTLSPLDPKGEALMSNYIPVLMSPVFFLGLSLLFCGIMLMLARMLTSPLPGHFPRPIEFGLFSGGLIALIAAAAFVWSYWQMPRVIDGQQYYDIMFWGGGHVLQFVHTQMLMVCWLLLMAAIAPGFAVRDRFLYSLFAIGLAVAFLTPLPYLLTDITSAGHRDFFTRAMIFGNGIAPLVLAVSIAPLLWRARRARKEGRRALWSSLFMSMLLFLYGGFLGGMIEGQNVVIPAHYHGSIVGVTLGFMGAAYLFLPRFGYRDVSGWRLAYWQPIVYGGGQLMHISGLAWSGGYGVLRKTPGGMEALPVNIKAAMGFMGLGGLIAIIGGFMFVIVVIKAMRRG